MKLQQTIVRLCLPLALILLAGCVPYSDHPLTPAGEATEDPALIGDWFADENGKRSIFRISRGDKPGSIRVRIEQETDSIDPSRLAGHLSLVADKRYMNLLSEEPEDDIPGYMFMRYSIDDDRLGISLSDPATLEKAIESGKLEGEIIRERWYSTAHITAAPEQLRAFVTDNDAEIFMETVYLQRLEAETAPAVGK